MAAMSALVINCTLKSSPEPSNTEALAEKLTAALEEQDIRCEMLRAADFRIPPGVSTDQGGDDQWPEIRRKILASQILILASPTWLARPSSLAQRVLERMDAMLAETDDSGRPVAYNRVAGFVVTGNEDGAHHVISELAGALIDIGFTVPGQCWTYWNRGPGPGDNYLSSDAGHDWSERTARLAAHNIAAVARALEQAPIPAASD
jgi:multimeric flavodoxin WrbA